MSLSRTIIRVTRNNVLGALLTLLVGVITARLLGPAGRGEYALFTTTVGLVGTFAQFGFYQAAVYFISKEATPAGEAFGALLAWTAIAMALVCLFVLALPYLFPGSFPFLANAVVAVAFVGAVLCLVLQEGGGGIAMAKARYEIYPDQLALEPLLICLATCGLFLLGGNSHTAVILRVTGSVLAIIIMWARLLSQLRLSPVFRMSVFSREVVFGAKVVGQNVIGLMNYRGYIYFFAGDKTMAGYFSVAILFCEVVRFLPNAIGTAIMPFLAINSHAESGEIAAKVCRTTLAAGLVIVIGFVPLSTPFIRMMFGAGFTGIAGPVVIMMSGALIGSVYQVMTRYFTSRGQQVISMTSGLLGMIAGYAACALLVPRFGLYGAAFSYVICCGVTCFVIARAFARTAGLPPRRFLFPEAGDWRQITGLVGRLVRGT